MSYLVHITKVAERDLNHAADYIEYSLKSPAAANALLNEAEQQIKLRLSHNIELTPLFS